MADLFNRKPPPGWKKPRSRSHGRALPREGGSRFVGVAASENFSQSFVRRVAPASERITTLPEQAQLVEPASVTLLRILKESNIESRRILIEKYGIDKFVRDVGPYHVLAGKKGVLYRVRVFGDEDMAFVRVVNSTPEPDGTNKEYWLRVPPQTRTVEEGLAWGFGLQADEYDPEVET